LSFEGAFGAYAEDDSGLAPPKPKSAAKEAAKAAGRALLSAAGAGPKPPPPQAGKYWAQEANRRPSAADATSREAGLARMEGAKNPALPPPPVAAPVHMAPPKAPPPLAPAPPAAAAKPPPPPPMDPRVAALPALEQPKVAAQVRSESSMAESSSRARIVVCSIYF